MHSLKFLLDADMPRSSAEVIRSTGYDVEDVRDIGMGAAKDREVIEYALKNERIIVTRDTDFGEILRYPEHPGSNFQVAIYIQGRRVKQGIEGVSGHCPGE